MNSQAFADPWATNKAISALDARQTLGGLAAPSTGATSGNLSGVFPGGTSGPGPSDDLAGYAAGGMVTGAKAGAYACDRGSLGLFLGAATASNTVTHAASNPSNPRLDMVVVRNRDPEADANVTDTAKLVILTGDPAANPSLPTSLLTSGDVPVYSARVRAGATSIVDSDIGELRSFVVARGGITPAVPGDTRPGAYEGQYRDNLAYDQLERWSGSAWEAVAVPAAWREFTPRLCCTGTGNDIAIGTGPIIACRYQLVGRRLDFNYLFRWGTPPFNAGTGNIYTFLPKHPVTGAQLYGVGYDQWFSAELWVNNSAWVGDFFGQAILSKNLATVQPYFPICSGHLPPNNPVNMNMKPYKVASQPGVTDGKSSVPQIFNPNGFPEGGQLVISGSAEVTW